MFAGFRISENEINPLEEFLIAIHGFQLPPSSVALDLVNQVAHYTQLTSLMAPFKQLLLQGNLHLV